MFRRIGLTVGLLAYATAAQAVIGTIDNVPAATVLFPYFDVDVQNEQGVNTYLSIQNSSATAVLANVTLWTDYGLPTDYFTIYLTGYDAQSIDLRQVFQRLTPRSATAGQDPSDIYSPKGPFSQDINFASCNTLLPFDSSNGVTVSQELQKAHSGQASVDYFGGNCGSFQHGDNHARGYVTADTVNSCGGGRPGTPNYFNFFSSSQNVLLGDWTIVDRPGHHVFNDTAVAIEASFTSPLTSSDPNSIKQTFYGRFVGYHADDHREPLPTAWGGFDSQGRTSLAYWRDPGVGVSPFACNGVPSPYPLTDKLVTAFDSDGSTVSVPAGNHFPLAAGITPDSSLGNTSTFGWLFTNMNLTAPNGPLGAVRQSWITYRQVPRGAAANSTLGYATTGVQLGNAANGDDPTIP